MKETRSTKTYRISSPRLKNFDYSCNAAYFVTICTNKHIPYCGRIEHAEIQLSNIGKIAEKYWLQFHPYVELDEFVVMPNHIHGILIINHNPNYFVELEATPVQTQGVASLRKGANQFGTQSKNLASIIRGFKSGVKAYATKNNITFAWQPRYYDRVIRDRNELERARKYIDENPLKWELEKNQPENLFY